MKIWELSVKRPVFMSCVLVSMVVVGLFSKSKIPVDLFPDVTFPVVTVNTIYPGASPNEIETLVSKPIEEELSSIGGVKIVRSINRESLSVVVAEFTLSTDIKYAEQQVRDKISFVKSKLPDDIEEPVIRRVDPSAQPIIALAIKSPLKGGALYDLANERIKPLIEQVNQVGRVDVLGGQKREIQVQVDRKKLNNRQLSASFLSTALKMNGQNVPAGKIDQAKSEMVFRTLGEFSSLDQIKNSVVSFFGNDTATRVKDIAEVVDSVEDEKIKAYIDGSPAAFLNVYKQSGANTLQVSLDVQKKLVKINEDLKTDYGPDYSIELVRDMSRFVKNNVDDVFESIILGIILTILVVYLFLGSLRSTLITGLSIPVSLVGSMTLLYLAGISINVMSLLAFSLAVGLLIDDAIVVRENIFRHMAMGKSAVQAALDGTSEVGMAVIAVTFAVLAVFGPIAFLSGVVGQFFKSFGLSVCFIMMMSLFDALSNAPLLSAYFGGKHVELHGQPLSLTSPVKSILILFDRFQSLLESLYVKLVGWVLKYRKTTLLITTVIIFALAFTAKFIPKTFLPPNDSGEFQVAFELKPGVTLSETDALAKLVEAKVKENQYVKQTLVTVGNINGQSYMADIYVKLVPFKSRSVTTTQVKEQLRESLKEFSYAQPKVKDVDFVGAGQRPFVVNIRGDDLNEVRAVSQKLYEKLKVNPGLIDPEITDKPGLPEFQVSVDQAKALSYGVNPVMVGAELRAQVEGVVPVKFREKGIEYDVKVRMKDDERDLEKEFSKVFVPNMNQRMVSLAAIANTEKQVGFATINRENRSRYISIEADISTKGAGMGGVISDINQLFASKEIELKPGITYRFVGQAENFQELGVSIVQAGIFAVVFIFLTLASLYESIVTPITIMIVIPLAVFGGFFGLFVMHSSLDLFSMIGCVMLMGLATKNSIILVDYINQKIAEGMSMNESIIAAGKTRLRPILMTSFALITGMLPVAIGLNEASSQRKSLGIAIIGGVAVSTLLTLLVIPAVFSYIESFRRWMLKNVGSRIVTK